MSALTPEEQAFLEKASKSPYPPIDIDPHFNRVVQNFRTSDYLRWATGTAFFPGMLYMFERADPTIRLPRGQAPAMRLCTFLGLCGGFLWAYQTSSFRLWGLLENGPEVARAKEQGNAAPGLDTSKSELTPYMQGAAFRNSHNAALKFATFPWFNFVNHGHHGPGVSGDDANGDGSKDFEE